MAGNVKGQLVLRVLEASGNNKDSQPLWENNFVQGFVKVEVRGGSRTVKAQSTQKRVIDYSLRWDEELQLNVLEDAKELRLMLCRERKSQTTGRVSASVTAACGIYVEEILQNVPIDKYFELFKPSNGGEGGTIHIKVDYHDYAHGPREMAENGHTPAESPKSRLTHYNSDDIGSPMTPASQNQGRTRFADEVDAIPATGAREPEQDSENEQTRRGRRGIPFKLLALGVLVGVAGVAAKQAANKR